MCWGIESRLGLEGGGRDVLTGYRLGGYDTRPRLDTIPGTRHKRPRQAFTIYHFKSRNTSPHHHLGQPHTSTRSPHLNQTFSRQDPKPPSPNRTPQLIAISPTTRQQRPSTCLIVIKTGPVAPFASQAPTNFSRADPPAGVARASGQKLEAAVFPSDGCLDHD